MAVSDPTMGVPTPTGVLQGVAAFAWDGSQWQPSGRAGPSVATRTGVLRGVAPFSWSGSAWTPAGRAGPDVATPTGVLDGVAVYTWSGSAWTPAGGQPTPSTPTGALRGVAAFNFDGTAWQPAGQAGPDVATPFGVLQGVAMFNWSGGAWTAVEAPPLDLNFLSATLDPSVTWTRASSATDGLYTDAPGSAYNSFANNIPRISVARGLLVEGGRHNYLLNSDAPVTQTTGSLATGTYCLWVVGTGTAAPSAGTAVGTGFGIASAGAPNVITITTAGTVVVTVAGSLTRFQLEEVGYASSYVPATAAAGLRQTESGTLPVGAWFSAAAGTLCVDFMQMQIGGAFRDLPTLMTDANNIMEVRVQSNGGINISVLVANASTASFAAGGAIVVGSVNRHALAYDNTTKALSACLNGGGVGSAVASSLPGITKIGFGNLHSGVQDGFTRRIRFWPRALLASELQQVTT